DGPAAHLVEAVEGVDQVTEEGVAAKLAVGDHVEAGGFLKSHRLVDGAILDLLELGGADLAAFPAPPRFLEELGAEQAADDVAADGQRGSLMPGRTPGGCSWSPRRGSRACA